jgi:ABC-type multidrug transport system fused ATPase/permease subunit
MEIASPRKIFNAIRNVKIGYLHKLFAFAFRYYPMLSVCIGICLLSAALEVLAMNAFIPLSAIAGGKAIPNNNVIIKTLVFLQLNSTSSQYIFLAYIVLFSLRFITQILGERMLMFITYNKMPVKFMSLALKNVLEHETIHDIEKHSSGQLIMLAGEEVHRACSIIATTIRFASNAVLICLYYMMIASFSPITGIGIVVFIAVTGVLSYGIFKRVHRLGILTAESSRTSTSILVDAFNGVRAVRAFGAERYVLNKFTQEIIPHKRRLFEIEFFSFAGRMIPTLLLIVIYGLYILIGGYISRIAFDYAFAITLLIFLLRFFLAVGDATNVFLKILSDAKSAQDITQIVHDWSDEVKKHETTQKIKADYQIETLEFTAVSFAYNQGDDILRNLTLNMRRGNSYALIGESGAGKSTLLDLLLLFYTPTEGSIFLNSMPIDTFDEQSLRHRIVLLSQETIIFNDTVRNNITYGLDATDAEVLRACSLSCIDDVINSLPNKFEEILQYRGTNLSGGQRQRIGIARALLRCPDVLILDESMSALDQGTKETVIENIRWEYKEKIVIFVSHDPAIREKVDIVLELRKNTTHISNEKQITFYQHHPDVSAQ